MVQDLLKRAEIFDPCTQMTEVFDEVLNALAGYGFCHGIYITTAQDFTDPCLLTTLPQLYEHTDPAQDPFLHYCCNSYDISLTGPEYLPDHDYLPPKAKQFVAGARTAGFLSGVGLPMRLSSSERVGGFNLGTALPRAEFEASVLPIIEPIRVFCLIAHRRIEEIMTQSTNRDALVLSPSDALNTLTGREREVAYLIASGLSRKECARVCGITPNTVSDYVKAIYRKLQVSNRVQLTHYFDGAS